VRVRNAEQNKQKEQLR
jgi:hypothetical protein